MRRMIVIVSFLLGISLANAQQVQVDASKLSPAAKAEVEQLASQDATVRAASQWVGLGREVGEAIGGGLEALKTTTFEVADHKVGKFTMFVIAIKLIGNKIVGFIMGPFILIFGWTTIIWSYRRACLKRSVLSKVTTEGGKTVKEYMILDPLAEANRRWVDRNSGESPYGCRAAIHGILGLIILLATILVIF